MSKLKRIIISKLTTHSSRAFHLQVSSSYFLLHHGSLTVSQIPFAANVSHDILIWMTPLTNGIICTLYLYSCLHVKDGSSFDISSQGIIFTKVSLWYISTHYYNIIFQDPIWCEGQWWLSKQSSCLGETCPGRLPCWVWTTFLYFKNVFMCVFSYTVAW